MLMEVNGVGDIKRIRAVSLLRCARLLHKHFCRSAGPTHQQNFMALILWCSTPLTVNFKPLSAVEDPLHPQRGNDRRLS